MTTARQLNVRVAVNDSVLTINPWNFESLDDVIRAVCEHFADQLGEQVRKVQLYDTFELKCEAIEHVNELRCLRQGLVYGTPKKPLSVVVNGDVVWSRTTVPVGVTYKDPRDESRFKVWEFHVTRDCTLAKLQKYLAMQSGVPVEHQSIFVGNVRCAEGVLPWSTLRDGEFATPYTSDDGVFWPRREWGNCLHLVTNHPVPK